MQTFLPFACFTASARRLDNRRLGKQRLETLTILRTLHGESRGWRHHPAVLMWQGYEAKLASYGLAICCEWRNRGFNDTVLDKIVPYLRTPYFLNPTPPWLGNKAFHSSHRSNLLRKDSAWYGQFGWTEPADLPYVWPKSHLKTHNFTD